MKSVKCPSCNVVNWSANESCIRCKRPLAQGSDAYAPSHPRVETPKSSSISLTYLGAGGGIIVLLLLVYLITKPTALPSAQNPTDLESARNAAGLTKAGEYSQDPAYFDVRMPDLGYFTADAARRMVAGQGDKVVTFEASKEVIHEGSAYPGHPTGGVPDEVVYHPEVSQPCDGKFENEKLVGYGFERSGNVVMLKLTVEADTFYGRAASRNKCGGYEPTGRKFSETVYVWKPGSSEGRDWVPYNEAYADPSFNRAEREKQREEDLQQGNDNEAKLIQEQKEREKKREYYRVRRAANQQKQTY